FPCRAGCRARAPSGYRRRCGRSWRLDATPHLVAHALASPILAREDPSDAARREHLPLLPERGQHRFADEVRPGNRTAHGLGADVEVARTIDAPQALHRLGVLRGARQVDAIDLATRAARVVVERAPVARRIARHD